jgi:peptide/nickel transport system permease protein
MSAADLTTRAAADVHVEPSPLRQTLAAALRQGRTRVGLVLTALLVLVALVGPLLAPHSPEEIVGGSNQGSGAGLLLGTDYLGRDVLSRVLHGGASVLWMAFCAATVAVFLGLWIGLVAAYSRSWLDGLLMRGMDILLAFPNIVFVLVVVSMIGPESWLIVGSVAVAHTPGIARIVRASALGVVRREFVEAAEVLGVPRRRILFREILPNITTPLLVEYGFRLTWAIMLIAALSFLGLGVQPPNADWGLMINENRVGVAIQPLAVAIPALCIAVFTVGTNLISEGMSRALAGVDRKTGAA